MDAFWFDCLASLQDGFVYLIKDANGDVDKIFDVSDKDVGFKANHVIYPIIPKQKRDKRK